jgi:glutathione synthase/RimK-type ligase-like ATP-grasp enzyme
MVAEHLEKIGAPAAVFHQRDFERVDVAFAVENGRVTGRLSIDGKNYRLQDFTGVYMRLMDDRFLPEVKDEPEHSRKRLLCRRLHDTLMRWTEIAPARVVNRLEPMGSNFSKPYQAQLIQREGFATPHTLVTNDPAAVRRFRQAHPRLIYKSISGVRSIVRELMDEDESRLDLIRWCPTQFQEYVEGCDVRVHVIGERVFATRIETTGTDYRYAHAEEGTTNLTSMDLPGELQRQCVRLAESLGLAFAGIDLKIAPRGEIYCFEVNPCPAYSYYEAHTGQPIAEAVARYLAGG